MMTWIKSKAKVLTTALATAVVSLVVAVPAFASEPVTLGGTVKTAIQTTVNDTIAMFGELLPIALTVFAFTWGVRKAMRFFKTAAN